MDAFDAVRRAAALLHDEVADSGVDSSAPIDIVQQAARRREIDITEVAPEDPVLRGALAIFDAQSLTIYCRNDGSAIDRALLVAHELGHVVMHAAGTRCEEHDIDIEASIEQAPVGLERVTDYGARERRELQANVFARELVLPMHVARRLYIDDALTTSAIADRMSLPAKLVRQQVLDAILLPKPDAAPKARAAEEPLDPSQEVAAQFTGSAYNLQAGPGTGKTRTLVARVQWLVEQGADPQSILVLTFSNRAAGELSQRFEAAIPEVAAQVWTGTFHAFGLDLIRRFYDRLGCSNNPRLFDRSDAIAALKDVFPTLPLVHYRNLWRPELPIREILAGISRAKDELTDCKRYRELASAMLAGASNDAERIAAEKCLEVALVYQRYEAVLRAQDAVDFGDLIMLPAMLLAKDEGLRDQLSALHRHVLVDEFQDVNRASARLLKAISGDGKRLWVVGDARQSIYRFRGASPANLMSFEKDFDGKAGRLAINYRSTQQVVDTFCAVAKNLAVSAHQLPLKLEASRGTGPASPEMRVLANPDSEAVGVAESILDLQSQGVELRKQAVLCRSNARLVAIAAALKANGVPVLHLGSLFERDDVRDLLALLSLSVDKLAAGLVRVGAQTRYGLDLQDVYIATKWLRENGQRPLEGLAVCATDAEGLSQNGRTGLSLLAADLHGLSQSIPPWEFLCVYLLDRTDVIRAVVKDTSIPGQMEAVALWQFVNFVRAPTFGGTGSPVQRLLDRVRELVLLAEERGLREVPDSALHLDAVRLLTVHGSKGLEFEAVHLPSLSSTSFPVSWRGDRCPPPIGMIDGAGDVPVSTQAKNDHDAEEGCLFFVALSRPKTHLRLYRSETFAGGKKSGASRYVGWLAAIGIAETPQTLSRKIPPEVTRLIQVDRASPFVPDVVELSQYVTCPKRFFYTHVLELGTAQRQTAFAQTHDVVRAFVKWYKVTENATSMTSEEVEQVFEEFWELHGPAKHESAAEYRALAMEIAEGVSRLARDVTFVPSETITLSFTAGDISIEPDQVGHHADGRPLVRRVNTGKKHSDEYDRLEYVAYRLVAEQRGAALEAAFLTDNELEPVPSLTAAKMSNRRDKIETLLGRLHRGDFAPEPTAFRCPNCPHFFICDAVPEGTLTIE